MWKDHEQRTSRYVGTAGTFASPDTVLAAEVGASGLPTHLFKADAGLRAAFLAGDTTERRVILVLRAQPIAEHAPELWKEHAETLQDLEGRIRSAQEDSQRTSRAAELVALREVINARLDVVAAPEVEQTQAEAIKALERVGVADARPLTATLNTLLATIRAERLGLVTELPHVAMVSEDRRMTGQLEVSVGSTGQGAYAGEGYRGAGVDVAVVDSGVDFGHPALSGRSRNEGRVHFPIGQNDGCFADTPTTDDLQFHGTHVAGIVGSLGASGWISHRGVVGVDAGIINLKSGWKSCTGGAYMYWSDGMNNVDWALRSSNLQAEVVTMSFGTCDTGSGNDAIDLFFDAVSFARDVPVTISAGNIGGSCSTQVSSPATSYNVVAVGSADDRNTPGRGDDILSSFSRRGPTADGRLKPDVVAPGSNIVSTYHAWEGGGTGNDFVSASGTSMATPHVAGAAALAVSAGLPGALRWKATIMNAADLQALGGAGVPNMDAGHGYMDLDAHYRWYKSGNFYAAGELAPTQPFRLLRLEDPTAADKMTLYWQRHVAYNNANPPFNPGLPSDLDLRVYAENTNDQLARSTRVIDNFEFLRGADFAQAADNVVKVTAHTFASAAPTEPWGLAASRSLNALAGPVFDAPVVAAPPSFTNGERGLVTATLRNRGDLNAHDVSVTLTLPIDFRLASGSPTQGVATLLRDGSVAFTWEVEAPASSCTAPYVFTVGGQSRSYGETFAIPAGSATTRINCPPAAVIAPVAPAECRDGRGTVQLDGSDSSDPNGDTLAFQWTAPGIVFDDATAPRPSASFPLGSTTVTLTVSDGELADTADADAVVQDTVLPDAELVRPAPGNSYILDQQVRVAPAGQVFVAGPLTVRAEASDDCGLAFVTIEAPDGSATMFAAPPYELVVDAPVTAGPHAARVALRALDVGGNVGTDAEDFLHVGSGCSEEVPFGLCGPLPSSFLAPDALPEACMGLAPLELCETLFVDRSQNKDSYHRLGI